MNLRIRQGCSDRPKAAVGSDCPKAVVCSGYLTTVAA
jgi:hypothetical protein